VLPLSYAVDAVQGVAADRGIGAGAGSDVLVVAAFILGALGLGAATLRRRTP